MSDEKKSPTATEAESIELMRELSGAFKAHLVFIAGAIRRALVPMYLLVAVSVITLGIYAILLRQAFVMQSRLDALAARVDTVATGIEEVQRTTETTKTTVDETQASIEEGPAVDVEIRPATSATPSASAVAATAVVVIRPKLPKSSAPATAVPSIEIPVPIPSSTPEKP